MINKLITRVLRKRSEVIVNRIKPYIEKSNKIIDIGSGDGGVTYLLKKLGRDMTPVDVNDFHGPRLVEPTIYDGNKLPFSDNSFDTALLLMVLHHTPDPKQVFSEAARVAKEIVLIETSYTNFINKWFVVFIDILGNLQFRAFWSSYKTDEQWKSFFKNEGFQIADTAKYHDRQFGSPFLHITYYLKKIHS